MCKGKVLLRTVAGIAAVALLSLSFVGVQADSQSCGSKAKQAATCGSSDAPGCGVKANIAASKVTAATVALSPAVGTTKASACCGSCDKAARCPASKAGAAAACCDKAGTAECCAADKVKAAKGKSLPTLQQIHAHQLPSALKSIDSALKALEKGDRAAAIRHLTAARLNIQTAQVALGKHVEPTFVNAVCPMMGSPIKPEKVTAGLTREYKGQKVGFCCGGCPEAWDKLTDVQKEEKLAKAKAKSAPLTGLKLKP
jgi:hypothetical protein